VVVVGVGGGHRTPAFCLSHGKVSWLPMTGISLVRGNACMILSVRFLLPSYLCGGERDRVRVWHPRTCVVVSKLWLEFGSGLDAVAPVLATGILDISNQV
jgi:hypothetical protein